MATPATAGAPIAAPAPQEDSLSILKALAEASAVFVALSFVGGWSYLASYYQTFGLDPLELDISVPVVSTMGVLTLQHVLKESGWLLLGVGVLLALVVAALAHLNKFRSRPLIVAGILLLLFGSLGAGLSQGRQTALGDMQEGSFYLPNVTFFTSKLPMNFRDALPACIVFQGYYEHEKEPSEIQPCKLLLHSGKMYYFFAPLGPEAHNFNMYTVEESEIDAVNVERGVRK